MRAINRHLNLFEYFSQVGVIPIENNSTRNLTIVLMNNQLAFDRFIDLVNRKIGSTVIEKPRTSDNFEINIQTAITELANNSMPNKIIGITLTTDHQEFLGSDEKAKDGNITDIAIMCCSGRIMYDTETDSCHLVIDGRPISASDFLRMLSTYEGDNLLFQIRELSEDVLEKDMVLAPLRIDAETILDRFKECLSWFLDGSFLSYKREPACSSALYDRLHEFERLCRHGKPETARAVGKNIIECLLAIGHDTDDFPDHLINLVEQYMPDGEP